MGRKSKKNCVKEAHSVQKEIAVLVDKLLRLTSVYPASVDLSKSWTTHLEICKILKEITSLEYPFINVVRNARKDSTINDKFVEWLKENGATFDGVAIKEFKGYDLGLMATKAFSQDSTILMVPYKIMMTELNADHSPELKDFIDKDILLRNMPNLKLAMFLLLEKYNPDSFWKPYIDMLPDTYTTVLYFTVNELKELKPSPVYDEAMKLQRNIARQYAYFYNEIHSKDIPVFKKLRKIFTYNNYRWAVSTVMTRQNRIGVEHRNCDFKNKICIDRDIIGFIPLWDMCNHEEGKITTDYNQVTKFCQCNALRDFKPGEQIFIYYGNRSNAELFLYNGFVYPPNENDDLRLAMGISTNDLCRNLKISILQKLNVFGIPYFKILPTKKAITAQLLSFVRVFVMEKEELEELSRLNIPVEPDSFGILCFKIAGPDIDIRAYDFLRTRCQLLLASYKCFQHECFDSEAVSVHTTNVNMLKECEIKILKYVIKHLEKRIQQIKETELPVEQIEANQSEGPVEAEVQNNFKDINESVAPTVPIEPTVLIEVHDISEEINDSIEPAESIEPEVQDKSEEIITSVELKDLVELKGIQNSVKPKEQKKSKKRANKRKEIKRSVELKESEETIQPKEVESDKTCKLSVKPKELQESLTSIEQETSEHLAESIELQVSEQTKPQKKKCSKQKHQKNK